MKKKNTSFDTNVKKKTLKQISVQKKPFEDNNKFGPCVGVSVLWNISLYFSVPNDTFVVVINKFWSYSARVSRAMKNNSVFVENSDC